jgi:hypothetical protein
MVNFYRISLFFWSNFSNLGQFNKSSPCFTIIELRIAHTAPETNKTSTTHALTSLAHWVPRTQSTDAKQKLEAQKHLNAIYAVMPSVSIGTLPPDGVMPAPGTPPEKNPEPTTQQELPTNGTEAPAGEILPADAKTLPEEETPTLDDTGGKHRTSDPDPKEPSEVHPAEPQVEGPVKPAPPKILPADAGGEHATPDPSPKEPSEVHPLELQADVRPIVYVFKKSVGGANDLCPLLRWQ